VTALEAGALDIVVSGPDGDAMPGRWLRETLGRERLVWVGSDAHQAHEQPLSLVTMQPPCSYRRTGMDALSAAGRSWHQILEANSIQGVQAAVRAGLGVSVVAACDVAEDMQEIDHGLPPLPLTSIIAYRPKAPHPPAERFLTCLREGLADTLLPAEAV